VAAFVAAVSVLAAWFQREECCANNRLQQRQSPDGERVPTDKNLAIGKKWITPQLINRARLTSNLAIKRFGRGSSAMGVQLARPVRNSSNHSAIDEIKRGSPTHRIDCWIPVAKRGNCH